MTHDTLRTLLAELAEEVSGVPQREYLRPAWTRARRVRRRRVVVGVAAAVVALAVPVALFAPEREQGVRPAEPSYSQTPLRGRAAHTATLLPDGRVLIIGGCSTDGCTTAEGSPDTEFYVPGRGFTPGPDLVQPRDTHTATLLRDGRVLVIGGWAREGTAGLSSAELYQPATGRFEPVGTSAIVQGGHTATLLPDGRVLVTAGAFAELFDPATNTFTLAAPLPEGVRAGVAIALRDGRVLVIGGTASALYDPGSGTWQRTGAPATLREKAALALLPDGRVLVLGGADPDERLLASTEIFDPATGLFTPGPTMDTVRYKFNDAVAVDARGRVIVAGGDAVAVYDGSFHQIPGTAEPIQRWLPTLTVLPDGDVLLVGGYTNQVRLLTDATLIPADRLTGGS